MSTNTALRTATLLLLTLVSTATLAQATSWEVYRSERFGIEMLIPSGASVETKAWHGDYEGWGGIRATGQDLVLHGLTKEGADPDEENVRRFVTFLTGIPARDWTSIDRWRGKNIQNLTWHKSFRGRNGSVGFLCIYGEGPTGAYLFLITGAPADIDRHRADLNRFHDYIRVR